MSTLTRIKPSAYHDSVTLMLVAQAVLKLPGVQDAAVVMGTPANREIIAAAGLLTPEAAAARPDDLLIVIKAEDEASALAALAQAEEILAAKAPRAETGAAQRPKSLASAIAAAPGANLAVISVAGRYAAGEARTALENGLHVLLFSDNVPLEEEIALKKLAAERGLLCMGPDAGTAIINGVALGFANAVPRGNVGLVSAAGTGLQAVTCGIARAGAGVSQAIGTGGRDLSEAVGGMTMLAGLAALQGDPDTGVIVLISKPPAAPVAARVLAEVKRSAKPTVVCFLGADPGPIEAAGAIPATNLSQAAVAVPPRLATGGNWCDALVRLEEAGKALIPLAAAEQARLAPGPMTPARAVCRRHLLLRGAAHPEEPARTDLQQRAADQGQQDARQPREPRPRLRRSGRGRVHPGPAAPDDRSEPAQPAHPPGGARSGHGGHPAGHRARLRCASRSGRRNRGGDTRGAASCGSRRPACGLRCISLRDGGRPTAAQRAGGKAEGCGRARAAEQRLGGAAGGADHAGFARVNA